MACSQCRHNRYVFLNRDKHKEADYEKGWHAYAVASLPGRHGIGDFGKESYNFVDLLKEAKAAIWQMLPLNPLGYGNSPYQPYSSCAGDELYINLDKLCEEGLLKRVPDFTAMPHTLIIRQ